MDVSLQQLVYGELMAVTSAMRKNSRWAAYQHMPASRNAPLAATMGIRRAHIPHNGARRTADREEVELIAAFEELKREVKESAQLAQWPVSHILAPFLELIRSPLSTGPITTAALTALHNLLLSGLLTIDSPGIVPALTYLSHVVSHCKFETSDTSSDEIVLLKIITLVADAVSRPLGHLFGDTEICEMLETVLTTSCHTRLSELLRRSTESNLHTVVRAMFSHLKSLDPEVEEQKLRQEEKEQSVTIEPNTASRETAHSAGQADETTPVGEKASLPDEATLAAQPVNGALPVAESAPYGLPAVIELFRAIIELLDPNSQKHTDAARLVALRALNVAVEVAGAHLARFPSLLVLVVDKGCRYLFQLARSSNPFILFTALRVIGSLFDTMKEHLKLQQELFFSFCIERLAPQPAAPSTLRSPAQLSKKRSGLAIGEASPPPERPDTPTLRPSVAPARGETRELMLETLLLLAQRPSFMVDLWANYDCDVNCEDLFERFVTFLSRSVYPSASAQGGEARQQPSQFQCLDSLLTFVNHMAARAEGTCDGWPASFPQADALKTHKSQKRVLVAGAAKFNVKPREGIAYLAENGLLGPLDDKGHPTPENVAVFLKSSPRLDKKLLGDWISRPENEQLLIAYLKLFNFTGKGIADAMRELLEYFRLPGEAGPIARITENFAKLFFAAEPQYINTEDAVYVLAYSVLMLNTDLHNPQNRKRMTPDDYKRNLRGMNGNNQDFAPEFLEAIYDTIRKREILMPEEHTGQVGFDYAWKELLLRSQQAGRFLVCNTNLFDASMFNVVWKQVISAIAYSLSTCDDDETIQRAVGGFRQCASLAGVFELPEVFDFIAATLSRATGLVLDTDVKAVNNPIVEVEGQSVMVSALSISFGTNIRGQLAAVVLFTVANSNADSIRDGWAQIFEVFQSLFLYQLLPTRMLQMEDFLGGVSVIPLQAPTPPSQPVPRSDAGLLSTLSSYLLTPYSASTEVLVPEATEAEVESTMSTIDCINACRLDELYSKIMSLESDALTAALRALQQLASDRSYDKRRDTDDDDVDDAPLAYDPASIFLLETMVSISCHRPDHIEETWPIVFEHLSSLLSMAQKYSMLLIERAVVGLLRLCLILSDKPSLRDQLYVALDVLGGLRPEVSNAVAEQIISGLALVVRGHHTVISSQTEWALVFSLLRATASHPEASKTTFELISELIAKGNIVSPENLAGFVAILDEFATIAGNSAEAQSPKARRQPSQPQPHEPAVDRGIKAVDLLYSLKNPAARLISESSAPLVQGWRRLHLPILTTLARQCSNPCRDLRHSALAHLQRAILGQQIEDQAIVGDIFNRVVFPLIDELLRPDVFARDPRGMPASRAAGSALLAKVFLHYESRPSTRSADVRLLWIQILDLFDRLMNVDRRDQLYESVPETLKNVVLVMYSSGILVPPPKTGEDARDEVQSTLWAATHERIERFLPGFLDEIIIASESGLNLPPPPTSVPSTPVVATAP